MKSNIIIILITLFLSACSGSPMDEFQEDADLIRLEHLEYWTEMLNQYHQIKGQYPFQEQTKEGGNIVLVKIATKQQLQYLSTGGTNYDKRLDNNQTAYFKERTVKEFITEMESGLGHEIEEKYDIQKVPTSSPVGYYYFTSKDGYLVWATCISCGVTPVSTLLMDGFTPTVNIVSKGMVGKVTKALTKDEMLNHPTYKSWVSRPFHKEVYVRTLVSENGRDSKH